MKLAVTYENGQIFQHFGHTAQFKIYEVSDGKIVWQRSRRFCWLSDEARGRGADLRRLRRRSAGSSGRGRHLALRRRQR